MTADLHACPAKGCPMLLPFELMTCKRHWYSLPPDLRRRVNASWRAGDIEAVLTVRRDVETVLNGAVR